MNKKEARLRRARKTRLKIASQGIKRLVVHRTNSNIYAQIIDPATSSVVACVSTLSKDIVKLGITNGGNIESAKLIGKAIAEKALASGVKEIAFDRSGFSYHGRVKALAESAREHGLVF